MKIVHEHTAEAKGAAAHRPGGVRFLSLLKGQDNTVNNYHLMLVYAQDYVAPRHRHNFDQLRIVLEGRFGFDRGQEQTAGMLGYFPEGTYYTQNGAGPSVTLLLQSGGFSGAGYMSDQQLRQAVDELGQGPGRFESGVYTWHDASGKKHNQDGYEAAWERVRGKTISYPKPLYAQPILWHQDRYPWMATDQSGVYIRHFGSFTPAQLRVAQVRIDAGSRCTLDAGAHDTLLYTISGQAHVADQTLRAISSVHLAAGESLTLNAQESTELYVIGLMKLT